ncbi:hypothetical protein WH47_10430 [Habropoda laboriosa]|uniref:Uncharacterized protein n=1 Tax=Habropoda laboriosa TaxID=597456 RepID=A0A0L7RF74_9HYME|nr:hypothetical protein WH47_10430 [Habropoda laboriosa]
MSDDNLATTCEGLTSFREQPIVFKKENTEMLYHNVKMILQDVVKGTTEVGTNLKELEPDIVSTAKLLKAIELNSTENES